MRRGLSVADPARGEDPGRGIRPPQIMTMRHWITSFRVGCEDEHTGIRQFSKYGVRPALHLHGPTFNAHRRLAHRFG